VLCCHSNAHASGPFSKFDQRPPDVVETTARNIFDVERCLLDMEGFPAPAVFRQPDRLDRVTLLWLVNNRAVGRADIVSIGPTTHIKFWNLGKQATACLLAAAPTR
jgi:hypothetical protein